MTTSHIVPPSQIQEGLDSLWNAQENKNKVKASLFNIIFFTKRSSREDYMRRVAFNLVEKFPARIFFIFSDPLSTESSIKTAVSVMTTNQGEFDITCDLIEVFAQGDGVKQIPFILLSHLVADLPIFLVWAEDPALEDTTCNEIKQFATRMIFDSECTEDLCRFSQSVAKIEETTHAEIADLNWARMETWRDLLSSVFSSSEKVNSLQKTSSIVVTYNSQETAFFCHTKIQSIYLQAWLASRLGWVPDKKRTAIDFSRFFYESEGRSIEVELKGVKNSDLPPGMILSFDLKTVDDQHYLFSRDLKATDEISVTYSTKEECKLPTKFLTSKGESGHSLIKEICHKGTSEHYKEVLLMISKWNRSASC